MKHADQKNVTIDLDRLIEKININSGLFYMSGKNILSGIKVLENSGITVNDIPGVSELKVLCQRVMDLKQYS